MKNVFYYNTAIGQIGIAEEDNHITNVFFESEKAGYIVNETGLIKEAATQLNDYLLGKRRTFDLPMAPEGTAFMKSVWNSLCRIPYGQTKSYKDIAIEAGNPKACRAVGMANNKNPIPVFIPCHRVIGASGKLVGYRGGLATKTKLLELEKQYGNF